MIERRWGQIISVLNTAAKALRAGVVPTSVSRAAGMAANIPLGRVGTAKKFANIACFLAPDLASYVTGTAINVDRNLCPVM